MISKELMKKILELSDNQLTEFLLYGNPCYNNETNTMILNCVIKFIIESKRFDGSII